MNRPIKFRAWDRQNIRMHEDLLLSGYLNVWLNTTTGFGPHEYHLMQFTGLLDRNGKEIYEGDIVQYDFLPEGGDQRAEVIYEGRSFCLKNGGNSYMPYSERMEVIGNIYENPELLK